ncbi:DUF2487 family protein [Melghirimyces algeriensis]|uniref:DUF2487 domain-containing protein n=1 Tax=Melghirimyces algeriensis TaxID=910412 RepID=A0A521B717_9BACL|nr:DUF2487 family protein [Melghirimyces algeriensis]SMO42902.1 Protein of unknown function [Melghirimyces algeriensis]
MRLSHLEGTEWSHLAPYVDTLLIPIYQIRIPGKQPDLGEARRVRELADRVERELAGRLLLLPAIPYGQPTDKRLRCYVESVVEELGRTGFHHLFLLVPESHSISLEPSEQDQWKLLTVPSEGGGIDSEDLAEELCQEIIIRWEQNSQE